MQDVFVLVQVFIQLCLAGFAVLCFIAALQEVLKTGRTLLIPNEMFGNFEFAIAAVQFNRHYSFQFRPGC